MSDTLVQELLTARKAATYLGVSKSFFEDHIRPLVPIVDIAREGSKVPMPRWAVTDLNAFIAARRRDRKSA